MPYLPPLCYYCSLYLCWWATSSAAVKYASLRPGSRDMCWRSLCTRTIRTQVVELGTVGGFIVTRLCIYLLLFFPMTGVFYNLALVYSLLCALFILVAEPYRDEYKCHNYLEPCVILSISLMLTAIVGVNTSTSSHC